MFLSSNETSLLLFNAGNNKNKVFLLYSRLACNQYLNLQALKLLLRPFQVRTVTFDSISLNNMTFCTSHIPVFFIFFIRTTRNVTKNHLLFFLFTSVKRYFKEVLNYHLVLLCFY